MSILEPLPPSVAAKVGAQPIISMKADVDETGAFGERWLVVSDDTVYVFTSNGTVLRKLSIVGLIDAHTDMSVGGGSLFAQTTDDVFVLVRYTAALANKFAYAANVLKALSTAGTHARLSADQTL